MRHLEFDFQVLANEILIFSYVLIIQVVEKVMLPIKGFSVEIFTPVSAMFREV